MKSKKTVFIISIIISVVTLALSIIFHIHKNSNLHYDFITDICLGFFSGALLTAVITLVEYLEKRKSNLEMLFSILCKQAYSFKQIEVFPEHLFTKEFRAALHERYNNQQLDKFINENSLIKDLITHDELEKLIEIYKKRKYSNYPELPDEIIKNNIKYDQDKMLTDINKIIQSYNKVTFYTSEIGNIYADTDFLFFNKKRKSQIYRIYTTIKDKEAAYLSTMPHFAFYISNSSSPCIVADFILELQKMFYREVPDYKTGCNYVVYADYKKEIDKMLDYVGVLCYGKNYHRNVKTNERKYIVRACMYST